MLNEEHIVDKYFKYTFEVIIEFVYLGFAITTEIDITLEIKRSPETFQTDAAMVSIGNCVADTALIRQN